MKLKAAAQLWQLGLWRRLAARWKMEGGLTLPIPS